VTPVLAETTEPVTTNAAEATMPASNGVVGVTRPVAAERDAEVADDPVGAGRRPATGTLVPTAASLPVVGVQDQGVDVPTNSPAASVAAGASSPEVAAVSMRVAPVPAGVGSPAPIAAPVAASRLGVGGNLSASDAFAAHMREHMAALAGSGVGVATAPLVLRRAYGPTGPRPASSAAAAAAAPLPAAAGPVGAGGVAAAAAAAGSAAAGLGIGLSLAALVAIAVFFSRLISLPAVPRPVPFISLLERPG
jgi:hypothetical protein